MKRLGKSFCVAMVILLFLSFDSSFSAQKYRVYVVKPEDKKVKIITPKNKKRTQKDINKRKQIECLADNIYHESRGESIKGQVAVGFVTLNRTKDQSFPDTVCGVVKEKKSGTCQFSWYCEDDKKRHSKKKLVDKLEDDVYYDIKKLAERVYDYHEYLNDPTGGSLYYHADYVKVKVKGKKRKAVIGKHIFYNITQKRT